MVKRVADLLTDAFGSRDGGGSQGLGARWRQFMSSRVSEVFDVLRSAEAGTAMVDLQICERTQVLSAEQEGGEEMPTGLAPKRLRLGG